MLGAPVLVPAASDAAVAPSSAPTRAPLASAGTAAASVLLPTEDRLRKRQRAAHARARSARADVEESSAALAAAGRRLLRARASLASAQAVLARSQAALAVAARADAAAQAALQAAEQRLTLAQAALVRARAEVVAQRASIGRLAASNYANGDPALMGLSVVLTSQDPSSVTTQLNTVSSLMGRSTTELAALKSVRAAMKAQEAEVARAALVVASQRRAAAADLVTKQARESEAVTARTQVARLVSSRRVAEARAARVRRADAAQLRAVQRQESRIKRLILARAARQRGGYRGAAGGVLLAPVPGPVTSPYGWRVHPIYHYWGLHDGTDFGASCGTANRAAGTGTVIAEDWSAVYGHRLYLDVGRVNGHNLTVVYNHLASYAVGSGARVARGRTVGYTGTTGWSTGCHLHFTVLRDGVPVDPMTYIS
ncbi:MAG: hypothetical protein JWR20_2837 [Marmoricola sp.]|nr:hypothetical protein [Marmoricola sp.]